MNECISCNKIMDKCLGETSEMVKFELYKTFSSIHNLRMRIIIKCTLKQGVKASFSAINNSSMLKYMSVKEIFILHELYVYTCIYVQYNGYNSVIV